MTPERTNKILHVLNRRQPDLAIVMENVSDPHNVFAVMRTCEAMGVQNIYVLNTVMSRHKHFGKKSSSSALGWLTVHEYDNTDTCMKVVKERYGKIYATHLGVESKSLYDLDLTESMALVFGNEKEGVTDACLEYCDGNFIIPMVGMIQSLNISVACAVTLYEAFRQRSVAGFYNGELRLGAEEATALSKKWKLFSDTLPPGEIV